MSTRLQLTLPNLKAENCCGHRDQEQLDLYQVQDMRSVERPMHNRAAAGAALPKRLSILKSQRLCNSMTGKLGIKYARFRCSSMCGPYSAL